MELNLKNGWFVFALLMVVVLVALNLDSFTGKAVKESTLLYVSSDPGVLSQALLVADGTDRVYFTVKPGLKGSSGALMLYDMTSRSRPFRLKTVDFDGCSFNLCRPGRVGVADFAVEGLWSGLKLCGEVQDKATGKMVQACFRVK